MIDYVTYGQSAGALLVLVGAIILMGLGARRLGLVPGAGPMATKRPKRLKIEEVLILDPRRRLVLVRHDTHEHLLVLGVDGNLVVHSGPAQMTPQLKTPEFSGSGDGRP